MRGFIRLIIRNIVFYLKDFISKVIKFGSRFVRTKFDENVLIFGGYRGREFLGNSKYLYLFFNKYSDYECIWISASRKIMRNLRKQGLNSIYKYSLRALLREKSANCIFITHNFKDVLDIKFSKKTRIVFIMHANIIKGVIKGKIKLHFTYFFIASEPCKKIFEKRFDFPPERIAITGLPRNDYLFNKTEKDINILKNKFNIPKDTNVIFYAPTFRRNYKNRDPLTDKNILEFEKFLTDTNSILIYKEHFFAKHIPVFSPFIPIKSKRLKILDPSVDPQELLLISDILISDYSSIMFDFLFLNRPIILFLYDLDLYLKDDVGLSYDLEQLNFAPISKNMNELLYYLKTVPIWDLEYKQNRKRVNNYVNISGSSCQRIADFLNLKIRKKEMLK